MGYYEDPEKKRARDKVYREANRDKKREWNRQWREANPEKRRDICKKYWAKQTDADRAKRRERTRIRYHENLEVMRARTREHSAATRQKARMFDELVEKIGAQTASP